MLQAHATQLQVLSISRIDPDEAPPVFGKPGGQERQQVRNTSRASSSGRRGSSCAGDDLGAGADFNTKRDQSKAWSADVRHHAATSTDLEAGSSTLGLIS